ncbi:MAG: substrate-binding domain-containing protein [bacterium]
MATFLTEQVKAYVGEQIDQGRFEIGSLLPDTNEIAEATGCSFGTAKRALVQLAQQGVLQRIPRKGTRVVRNPGLDLGRICLLQSHDAHANGLLVEPIFSALSQIGASVDVVPFSEDSSVTLDRCRHLRGRPNPAECLVSLSTKSLSPQGATILRQVRGLFDRRIQFSVEGINPAFDDQAQWVGLDDPAECRAVMEYLLGLGHRRIAVDAGLTVSENGPLHTKAEICRHMIEMAGGECVPIYFFETRVESLPELFRARGITAYWAHIDYQAFKTVNELHRAGVDIPGEITVIGRNDTPWCRESRPMLTSVSWDPPAVAAAITAAVRRQAEEPDMVAGSVTRVAPKLVPRDSSGPVPQGRRVNRKQAAVSRSVGAS